MIWKLYWALKGIGSTSGETITHANNQMYKRVLHIAVFFRLMLIGAIMHWVSQTSLLPTFLPTPPQLGFVVFSHCFHYYFSLADVEVEQLQFDIDVVELNNWIRSSRVLYRCCDVFFFKSYLWIGIWADICSKACSGWPQSHTGDVSICDLSIKYPQLLPGSVSLIECNWKRLLRWAGKPQLREHTFGMVAFINYNSSKS